MLTKRQARICRPSSWLPGRLKATWRRGLITSGTDILSHMTHMASVIIEPGAKAMTVHSNVEPGNDSRTAVADKKIAWPTEEARRYLLQACTFERTLP